MCVIVWVLVGGDDGMGEEMWSFGEAGGVRRPCGASVERRCSFRGVRGCSMRGEEGRDGRGDTSWSRREKRRNMDFFLKRGCGVSTANIVAVRDLTVSWIVLSLVVVLSSALKIRD